jgi:hypothetical protein
MAAEISHRIFKVRSMFEEKTRCAKQKEGSEEYTAKLIGFKE